VVRLETDEVLAAHAGQLRPGPGSEDYVRSVQEVVDRQDYDLTVREKPTRPTGTESRSLRQSANGSISRPA
jgi:hypothetical protein